MSPSDTCACTARQCREHIAPRRACPGIGCMTRRRKACTKGLLACRGLVPSVAAILPEAAITYGLFDILKRSYVHYSGKKEAGVVPSLAAGVIAAFTGQVVAYPLETVSRRMQVRSLPMLACSAAARCVFAAARDKQSKTGQRQNRHVRAS